MFRLNAKWRINIGLISLLIGQGLLVGELCTFFGIVPDWRHATLDGRGKLCEALTVTSSAFISQDRMQSLETILQVAVGRNDELLSAAVRRDDGEMVLEVGEHAANWQEVPGKQSADHQVTVPILASDRNWGTAEFRFKPILRQGLLAFLYSPWTWFTAYLAALSTPVFYLYLSKMLAQLNPSKAVPERVRDALDTLAEGLLLLDSREQIAFANRAFASAVGASPEKLLGRRASDFPWSHPGDEELNPTFPWTRARQQGVPLEGVTLGLTNSSVDERRYLVNCSPLIAGTEGKCLGVLVSFEDVTQLEATKRAAEAASRAKSDFLANMSHEIRTPMNAILGFTDVLRRGFEKSEAKSQQHLNTIHSSGQHLLALINDILDLSKVEAGKMEVELLRCSPHQVVAEVVAMLGVKAQEKNISLEYNPSGDVPETIVTDPGRLRQTLMNLVGNAIKFTETGGVHIVSRLLPSTKKPEMSFEVIDTGIGMAPDVLETIFEPFAQADSSVTRRFGGTGLGLAISRCFAEALGGRIEVESEPGQGTKFTVTVDTGPLDGIKMLDPEVAQLVGVRDSMKEQTSQGLRSARILVVDDGEENRDLLSLVLGQFGVDVETTDNAPAGIEMATRSPYDVILMDMQMPVMDGYTAARTLREEGYKWPIIAVTANAMKSDEERCLAAGCSGFLTKPVDIDKLYQTLTELLGNRREPSSSPAAEASRPEPSSIDASGMQPTHSQASTPQRAPTELDRQDGPLVSTLPTHKPQFANIVRKFVGRLASQLDEMDRAWAARDFRRLAQLSALAQGIGREYGI